MSKAAKQEAFETPARVRPEHYVRNPEAPATEHLWAVRDDSPLGKAFANGKLDAGGRRGYTGRDRYSAALTYRAIWDTIHSTGSSTKFERVQGSSAVEARTQQGLVIARQQRKMIEARMSADHAYILRCFIGEGSTGSEAVNNRVDGFKFVVWAFICSALDALIDAIVALNLQGSGL